MLIGVLPCIAGLIFCFGLLDLTDFLLVHGKHSGLLRCVTALRPAMRAAPRHIISFARPNQDKPGANPCVSYEKSS
jgi:hypothetical protein